MSNKCFVSIIVPIYNVEQYLDQCVSSVLSQSFRDFELILVDDGSPDHCAAMCDDYAINDPRVQVLHKKNGGLSDARNAGLEKASGEYVLFLDADDYWDDENALAKLFARIELTGADILHFSYKKFFEDIKEVVPYFDSPNMPMHMGIAEQHSYLAENGLLIASACNKLIRRSLLRGIAFEKGVYSEDITWCLDVAEKAASMDFICESFYCYRQRERSITHVPNNKRCADLAKAIIGCIERIDRTENHLKELFCTYTAFQFGTFILVQAQAQEQQKEWIRILSEYKKILKYHKRNKKLLGLRIGCLFLGYRGLCSAVRIVYKLLNR